LKFDDSGDDFLEKKMRFCEAFEWKIEQESSKNNGKIESFPSFNSLIQEIHQSSPAKSADLHSIKFFSLEFQEIQP
jgi:hypothetical protein